MCAHTQIEECARKPGAGGSRLPRDLVEGTLDERDAVGVSGYGAGGLAEGGRITVREKDAAPGIPGE